jgi:hypothetical protein
MCKRTINRIVFSWILLLIIVALFGKISVAASDGGRTSADFLQIGLGARAAGMGGAYTAVAHGAVATYWNPAGLAGMDNHEVMLGHFSWYQDINLEHGSFAYSLDNGTGLAASMTYLSYGNIEGYDQEGFYTGELTAYDWAGALSAGFEITDNLAVGLTGKVITQKLDQASATAFAADFGLRCVMNKFTFALVASNFGTKMKFDEVAEKLPATTRIGIAASPFNESFITSLEFEKKIYGRSIIRYGIELNFEKRYFLRTGYKYYFDQTDDSGTGLSMGAGIRYNKLQFDYAYTLRDNYTSEDIHRFSLVFFLNN